MTNLLVGQSVRGRAVRFLLVVGLVPLVAVAAYIFVSQRAVLTQTANDNLANHAALQAASVERLLDEASGDIEVLVSNPVLQSRTASLEEKSKQMREAQDFFEVFEDSKLAEFSARAMHLEGSFDKIQKEFKKTRRLASKAAHELIDKGMRESFSATKTKKKKQKRSAKADRAKS